MRRRVLLAMTLLAILGAGSYWYLKRKSLLGPLFNQFTYYFGSSDFRVAGPQESDPNPVKLGVGARIGKRLLPDDDPWNRDVSADPVDGFSKKIIERIGADVPLHPDFGTWLRGEPNGIPYVVVGASQPKAEIRFDRYGAESDPGPYPVPFNAPIEGGPRATGDRHVIALDRDAWKLYELFDARPQPGGGWLAASGAIFDLKTGAARKFGWTSADAAGLPILPGLVRYDEVQTGAIEHALRFTVRRTRRATVPPATHYASDFDDEDLPPMGMRLRLRADFDLSGYSPECRVILKALQKYGMICADNGGDWFLSGAPDSRWSDWRLRELKKVRGRDFDAIAMKGLVLAK